MTLEEQVQQIVDLDRQSKSLWAVAKVLLGIGLAMCCFPCFFVVVYPWVVPAGVALCGLSIVAGFLVVAFRGTIGTQQEQLAQDARRFWKLTYDDWKSRNQGRIHTIISSGNYLTSRQFDSERLTCINGHHYLGAEFNSVEQQIRTRVESKTNYGTALGAGTTIGDVLTKNYRDIRIAGGLSATTQSVPVTESQDETTYRSCPTCRTGEFTFDDPRLTGFRACENSAEMKLAREFGGLVANELDFGWASGGWIIPRGCCFGFFSPLIATCPTCALYREFEAEMSAMREFSLPLDRDYHVRLFP